MLESRLDRKGRGLDRKGRGLDRRDEGAEGGPTTKGVRPNKGRSSDQRGS